MYKVYLLLLSLFLLSNCESPYVFDLPNREFISIEGYLTLDNESSQVRVSKAVSYNNGNFLLEKGANVFLYENGKELIQFTEIASGIFRSPENMNYNVNSIFQLHVYLKDGRHYISPEESFPKPIIVNNITWQVEDNFLLTPDYSKVKDGSNIVFYADFGFDEFQDQFLKWDYSYDYQLNTEFVRGPVPTLCYIPRRSGLLPDVIASSEISGLKKYQINSEKMDFRFNDKIVFKIRALSIGKNSFDYYNAIHNQILNTGSLFDKTPSRIDGGMRNIDDQDEVVLGHFAVFDVTAEVLRITNEDLGNKPREKIDGCYPALAGFEQGFCFDCRLFDGAEIEEPEDWEE